VCIPRYIRSRHQGWRRIVWAPRAAPVDGNRDLVNNAGPPGGRPVCGVRPLCPLISSCGCFCDTELTRWTGGAVAQKPTCLSIFEVGRITTVARANLKRRERQASTGGSRLRGRDYQVHRRKLVATHDRPTGSFHHAAPCAFDLPCPRNAPPRPSPSPKPAPGAAADSIPACFANGGAYSSRRLCSRSRCAV
jgi:hypothetical protein